MKVQKTKFRPFTILQIPKIERWLSEESERGFKLVSYKLGVFTFEECGARKREYFVFTDFLTDKKRLFSGELFLLRKLYSSRNSALNKNKTNSISTVIEVDCAKVNEDYYHFLRSRADYYKRQYLQSTLVHSIFSVALGAVALFETSTLSFVLPFVVLFASRAVYSLVSIFVLKKQNQRIIIK